MAFSVTNFIKSYISTAKFIELQNTNNQKVYTFSICNYQKSVVDNSNLLVFLQDNNIQKQYILDFSSNGEAIQSQVLLKDTINFLKPNCEPISFTPPSPSQTPIPITYVNYKSLQQASSLFTLQWYDVTDATNLLGFGGVTIRLLAKAIDDYQPAGIILGTKQLVNLNTLDDTIQRFEFSGKKILGLNNSKITYDTASLKITAINGSIVTVTSSTNIEVNSSTAVINNSSYINITNGSNINLNNASKIVIDNIQQDLTSIGFNLQNVVINQSDSIGKIGKDLKTNPVSQSLISYKDVTDQELRLNTNDNNITITLHNLITQANGEFRILFSGTGLNNIITIKDNANNNLLVLNDTLKDAWAVFRYNKSTSLFEFINLDFKKNNSHIVYQVNATINSQTLFTLPSPATDPVRLTMIVNGQDQIFGLDFTYTSPDLVTYLNRQFTLEIGDEVKFLIY